MPSIAFASPTCAGELHSAGAMLGAVRFNVSEERWVSPFAAAPWRGDQSEEFLALPNLLKFLGSEWPCIPFGIERAIPDLGKEWLEAGVAGEPLSDSEPHGFAANHEWHIASPNPQTVYARISYPESHDIVAIERTVAASLEAPRLEFSLTLHPRRNARLPIGVHPVFALPEQPGAAELFTESPTPQLRAWTFPANLPYGCLQPHQEDCRWEELRNRDGAFVNITNIPLSPRHEDQLLLTGLGGSLTLRLLQWNYQVTLEWDPTSFPACLLWLSNGALPHYPFCGRYRAIGIEPIAAAFDLGATVAGWRGNPLSRRGIATAVELHAKRPWQTRYSIACGELRPGG